MLVLARTRIETDRLRLLPVAAEHAERLSALANHKEIASNLASMPHPFRLEDAKAYVRKVEANAAAHAFVVIEKASDEIIGSAGYGPVEDGSHIDFGYWLGLDHWGQGYATEAAHAVITHAFCVSRIDEILTDCRIDNPGSRRVLEKLGFISEGPAERYSLGADETVPTEKMRLVCKNWLATKACA